MPPTRRSTGGARARPGPPAKDQPTISFAGRVTKSIARNAKKRSASPASPANHQAVKAVAKAAVWEPDVSEVKLEAPKPVAEEPPPKTPAELDAEAISDSQILKYWKQIEAQRLASRAHQQDLTTAEKILRYFDVSSQYGPCIGISRARRWRRAEKLGLNPPLVVLAVLLKEERQGNDRTRIAHIDEIMNPATAVEVS